MTDDRHSEDELLSDRIRRSMAHYTFDHPPLPARNPASPWRWPVLVAAVLGGAAAATLAISLLGGLPRAPLGNVSPTPSASGSPATSPSGDGTPLPSPVSEELAGRLCRSADVLDDWLRPGETQDQVAERLRQLPLVHADQRARAASFIYADQRFIILCQVDHGTDGDTLNGVFTGLREPHDGGLEYSGGGSSPGSVDPGAVLPDLMMYGSAAPRFVSVEVVLEDGEVVPAWLGQGIWFAWWNEPISSVAIRGYDREGEITTLDEGITAVTPEPQPTDAPAP